MKAWRLNNVGDVRLEDVEIPKPGAGEVLIKVKAAGICGSDIPRIYDTGAHKMPLTLGHEFAGIVDGVGDEVSSEWVGKRVAVYPKIPCGKCYECRNGNPNMCETYDYVGSRRDGAFAEFVTAPASNLLVLPEDVGFEEAAMLEPLAVSANAVRRAVNYGTPKEAPIVVCGLGTIGLMTLMLLIEAGYDNIYVIGNKPSQVEKVARLGISEDRFCNSRETSPVLWINSKVQGGIKAYFECVGRNESISYGLDSSGSSGLIVLVGNPYSDMTFSRDTYWKILRKQLVLSGIWNSSFAQVENEVIDASMEGSNEVEVDDWNYVLGRMKDNKVNLNSLISHRFRIDDLEQGFQIMKNKTEDYCKVMMVI